MDVVKKPDALAEVEESRLLDLDVRADLRAGREPFQRIMHARHALAHDGVLRVRAIFEPKPLYRVMGNDGFEHWTERLADDDWRVWFYRGAASPEAVGEGAAEPRDTPARTRRLPTCGTPGPEPADVHVLDVRDLEPPEPMVRTLEALTDLPRGHTLLQLNRRVPRFLLPELDARGFQHTLLEDDGDTVRVAIRHAEDVPVLDVRLLPSRRKHPTIFETFDALEPGGAFVLLNDHDPVPLRYQLEAERPGAFTWEYLEEGPEIWRVRIGRTG